MRRHQDTEFLNIKIGIIILVVILILVLIIWKPFSSNGEANEDTISQDNLLNNEDLDSVGNESTEAVEVTNKKISDKGLCEKYLFKDRDTLEISDYKIEVEAIGDSSIKVVVDGEMKILSEEEDEYFKSGLNLEIRRGSIFYQGSESEHNRVEILVGCDSDENSNDKYVREKGVQICEKVYDYCLEEFNIEN